MASITVAPAALSFVVRKGSTLRRTITWYSDPVWEDRQQTELNASASTPLDLTGYDARMQVRDRDNSDVLVFELTPANGGLTLGDTAGTITFFISDSDTDDPVSDDCVYDLEVIEPSGDVVPLIAGTFKLTDQITV